MTETTYLELHKSTGQSFLSIVLNLDVAFAKSHRKFLLQVLGKLFNSDLGRKADRKLFQ